MHNEKWGVPGSVSVTRIDGQVAAIDRSDMENQFCYTVHMHDARQHVPRRAFWLRPLCFSGKGKIGCFAGDLHESGHRREK